MSNNSINNKDGQFFLSKFKSGFDFGHYLGMGMATGILLLSQVAANADPLASTLPTIDNIESGSVNISQSGNNLNINQSSNNAIVNYQDFSVGQDAAVNFNLPNANAAILNRVTGSAVSEIWGQINANQGRVFISNPNGIHFGPNSSVNVDALVATTHNIDSQDFLDQHYKFYESTAEAIVNDGAISATNLITFIASSIVNNGYLEASDIHLALGGEVTVQFTNGSNAAITILAIIQTILRSKIPPITTWKIASMAYKKMAIATIPIATAIVSL